MLLRCTEPGWVELVRPDERRGVWLRVDNNTIELCAGREGSDAFLSLKLGEVVSEKHIYDAQSVLSAFIYAKELNDIETKQWREEEGIILSKKERDVLEEILRDKFNHPDEYNNVILGNNATIWKRVVNNEVEVVLVEGQSPLGAKQKLCWTYPKSELEDDLPQYLFEEWVEWEDIDFLKELVKKEGELK